MGKHVAPEELKTETTASSSRLWLQRIGVVVGIALVGIASALAGFAIVNHKNPIAQIAQIFVPPPDQVFGKTNLLVLVEGLDYDYNAKDEEYSTQSRSDVIKAVNLDFKNRRIYVLSVLRDTAVVMPNGHEAKINEAQSEGGTPFAEKVIAGFLGVPGFDRFVVLRINTAKDLIDALGGVDVNVQNSDPKDKSEMSYDDSWGHLHIHLKPGFQHLNGTQAVGYMRFRHDFCGDPCRSKRQDQVLKALADKLKGDKMNTLLHAGNLVDVFRRDVTTNFTTSELGSLMNYYAGLEPKEIHSATAPFTGDKVLADGGDALVSDDVEKTKLVESMLIAPPQPIPSPDARSLAAIAPSTIVIDVENGSGVPGAAHRAADALRKAGYAIGDVGDAPSDDHVTTEIYEHSKKQYAGAKVRSTLPAAFAKVTVNSSSDPAKSDVTLVVGKDLATLLGKKPSVSSTSP